MALAARFPPAVVACLVFGELFTAPALLAFSRARQCGERTGAENVCLQTMLILTAVGLGVGSWSLSVTSSLPSASTALSAQVSHSSNCLCPSPHQINSLFTLVFPERWRRAWYGSAQRVMWAKLRPGHL